MICYTTVRYKTVCYTMVYSKMVRYKTVQRNKMVQLHNCTFIVIKSTYYKTVHKKWYSYKMVRCKTVHRHSGVLHNMLHYFQKSYISRKGMKSIDTEEKSTTHRLVGL
jgi:hypothetical protein